MDKDASGQPMSCVAQEPSEGGRRGGARQAGDAGATCHAGGVAGNARTAPLRPLASGAPRAAGGKEGGAGWPVGAVRRSGDGWEAADPAQSETATRLARYEPRARDAYLEALYALQQDECPGRLVHAAHSLREVIDLLARSKQAKHERKKSLGAERRKALLQEVFDPIARRATRTDDECDGLVRMYSELSEIAHHGKTATKEELAGALSGLEETLRILEAPQLAVNKEMDDMLSRPPSEELARRLVGMQNRWATQLRLPENLPAEWLPYMEKAGYFSEPRPADAPRARRACKHCGAPLGSQPADAAAPPSYLRWPPSTYLRRCARRRGREVAKIILDAKFKGREGRNPAVYIDFLACACDLPLPDAERVGRKALEEGWSDFAGITQLAEGYFDLAKRLYLEGRHCTAAEMLLSGARSRLLEAHGAPWENAAQAEPLQPAAPLDTDWFAYVLDEKVLPLAKGRPWPVMDMLGRLLDEAIEIGGKSPREAENVDVSWQALQDLIVERIVGCIRECIPRTPGGMRRLRRVIKSYNRDHTAFRRIELSAYAEFPDGFGREIETALLAYFDLLGTRVEYRSLLKASFGSLSRQARQKVLKRIDGGLGQDRLSRLAEEYGRKKALDTEKHWKLKHLHPIRDHLEGEHLATYLRLLKETGESERPFQEQPAVKFRDMGQDGGGALAGKNADQVFEYMRDYENNVNEVFEGSTKGIEFEGYAKRNPKECSKRAHGASDLSPASQCCLLSGLDGALREGNNIDWDGALQLIEYAIAARRLHGREPAESALLNAMCRLIEEGLRGDFISAGMRGRVWRIIEALVWIGAECTEDADARRQQRRRGVAVVRAKAGRRAAEPAKMSPLDASRSGIGGLSFHAVYRYAAWCKRHGGEKGALAPEAKRMFDSYLGKGMGAHSAARHAVLGAFLTGFYQLDLEWAERLPSRIASGRDAKAAFWESYVTWNDVYPHAFKDLLPLYREFSKKGAVQGGASKRASEFTIIHVMLAHLYGLEGADKPVKNLLGGSGKTLQECARQVGNIIRGKADDPDFDKERLAALWRHPGLAKCDLGMWLVNSPLDRRDTVTLYRDHVAGYQGKINLYTPVKHLAPYARDFPEEVSECLDMLVGKCDGYVPDHVRDVLAILRGSDSLAVKEKCRAIDEKLAQRGREWGP